MSKHPTQTERRVALTARVRAYLDACKGRGEYRAAIARRLGISVNQLCRLYLGQGQRDAHHETAQILATAMGMLDERGRPDVEALYAPLGQED